MSSWRELDDFKFVVEAIFRRDSRAVLVGGQACNFYSRYYIQAAESLRGYLPFTSHDIDIYVPDNATAAAAAAELHAHLAKAPAGIASPVRSAVTLQRDEGELLIQFMREAYGIKTEDLVDAAIEYDLFDCRIRVMHPIFLLQSKVACLKGLDQSDRQDKKHIGMAICFCACFVHELVDGALSSIDEDKAAVAACQHILSIASSEVGLQVHYEDGIKVELAVPIERIRQASSPKLTMFATHNLDRLLSKLSTDREAYQRRRLSR